jgi:hypothetical protein
MTQGPPELTRASFDEARKDVHPHDHAVFTYGTRGELTWALGAFLADGVAREELTVFVHAFETDAEAWALLTAARLDAPRLRSDQLAVVSLYKDAFEGAAGRIDYEHVKGVVGGLLSMAQQRGRKAVRIFVDASRVYLATQRSEEWFAFEEWLGRRLQNSVGLVCAYRREDVMQADVFPRVLRTHAYRFDAPR